MLQVQQLVDRHLELAFGASAGGCLTKKPLNISSACSLRIRRARPGTHCQHLACLNKIMLRYSAGFDLAAADSHWYHHHHHHQADEAQRSGAPATLTSLAA